jgi:phosphatidylinositol phospholipase C delta
MLLGCRAAMLLRCIGRLLLFLYPRKYPIMEADNNTYDFDTQIQEQLTDYYKADTDHNLDTSTWTDVRLSPEILQWVEGQKIVCMHFIILVVRSNIKV